MNILEKPGCCQEVKDLCRKITKIANIIRENQENAVDEVIEELAINPKEKIRLHKQFFN